MNNGIFGTREFYFRGLENSVFEISDKNSIDFQPSKLKTLSSDSACYWDYSYIVQLFLLNHCMNWCSIQCRSEYDRLWIDWSIIDIGIIWIKCFWIRSKPSSSRTNQIGRSDSDPQLYAWESFLNRFISNWTESAQKLSHTDFISDADHFQLMLTNVND